MALDYHLNRIRSLSIYLFISGAINIFLMASLGYLLIREQPYELKAPYNETKLKMAQASPTNANLLAHYKTKPYEQLLAILSKTGLVEDGFSERDLALSVLVAYHDFDLERALGGHYASLQKRSLQFNEGKDKVVVFPSLSKPQYEAIYTFAKTEKWPFKAKGLFLLLNTEHFKDDPDLHNAFFLTKEFSSFEDLLKGHKISKDQILYMIREGGLRLLASFHEKQLISRDTSAENRQKWLLSYIKEGSATAASFLVLTDFDFALKRLPDSALIQMVKLLENNTPANVKFLASLAASPRSDALKSSAIAKYSGMTGKAWEPLVSRETAPPLEKVVAFTPPPPVNITPQMPVKKTVKKDHLYVVQDGDSLWKVAKRFKVTVEEIQKLNSLKNDTIKPGTFLTIPNKG